MSSDETMGRRRAGHLVAAAATGNRVYSGEELLQLAVLDDAIASATGLSGIDRDEALNWFREGTIGRGPPYSLHGICESFPSLNAEAVRDAVLRIAGVRSVAIRTRRISPRRLRPVTDRDKRRAVNKAKPLRVPTSPLARA